MDFWHKARSFAEEATKRSHELAKDAARRSQDLSAGASRLSHVVAHRIDLVRSEAARRADEVRRVASGIGGATLPAERAAAEAPAEKDLETFGVTEELAEFVQGITPTTFRDFPLEDDTQLYDVDTVSNVRQDLSEWQERHASLVLSTVKDISKLRYELCPRFMKERMFWRIYFILVNNHVAPYEKRYMLDIKSKAAEQGKDSAEEVKDDNVEEPTQVEQTSKTELKEKIPQSKTSISSTTEEDIDVFLLGDPGDSDDGGPDDDGADIDDDFDKMLDGLQSVSFEKFREDLVAGCA